MADPHLAALRTVVTAEEWSGEIEVESALDGDVTNGNVHRYRSLDRTTWSMCDRRVRGRRDVAELPHQHLRHRHRHGGPYGRRRAAAHGAELRPSHRRAVHRLVVPVAPGHRPGPARRAGRAARLRQTPVAVVEQGP
ncbi:hypothetical protein GCM10010294_05770 [Streptomyces griseoloalbus]|nr:hypothetical protein GCM10010294_05770 [Streptomyces griseoloalbus]